MSYASDYESADACIKGQAAAMYMTFNESERTLVQFGMFPADKMKQLDAALQSDKELGMFPMYDKSDLYRLAAVGIMDAANAGKDKMVV